MKEISSSSNSKNLKRQSTTVSTECKICGAPAIYSYYSSISCHSCKMFFKRNAERGQEAFKCRFDGHCEINMNNRHVCSYCRRIKCFASGMQIEMIRFSRSKKNKTSKKRKVLMDPEQTRSTALVRLNEPEQFRTINLLRSDQSTLSIDQWNLLSNLSHCYDEHSGLAIGQRYMIEQYKLPLKLRFKSTSMIELFQMISPLTQLLYQNNQDFVSLSSDDRSTLLHNTIKHTTVITVNFLYHQIGLLSHPIYYNTLEIITHPDLVSVAKLIADRIDFDVIVMKLFLAILSCSAITETVYLNTPPVNLSNMKQILRIQDTYIELTWRYLLYKYNYQRAVLCFSDLIRCVFAVHDGVVRAHEVQWFTETTNSLAEQTKQALTVND